MLNYDNNMKFIFLQLQLVFENTKNNQYEKDMANSLLKRFHNMIKDNFILIKKDLKFYLDIINHYLNCKFINEENKYFLNIIKSVYTFMNNSGTNKFYII